MTGDQLLTIALAGVLTYVIRASFLAVAGSMRDLPPVATTMLRMIPAAALSAIVLPGLLRPDGAGFDPLNAIAVGGVVAVVVSVWRRSIGLSLLAGLVVVAAARPLLG